MDIFDCDKICDEVIGITNIFNTYLNPRQERNLSGYSLTGKLALFVEALETNSRLKTKFFRDFGVGSPRCDGNGDGRIMTCETCLFNTGNGCQGQCLETEDVSKEADKEMIGDNVYYGIENIGDK